MNREDAKDTKAREVSCFASRAFVSFASSRFTCPCCDRVVDNGPSWGCRVTSQSGNPWMAAFDPQRFLSLVSRSMQGPEEAMRVYREMLGLEGGSRERAVD